MFFYDKCSRLVDQYGAAGSTREKPPVYDQFSQIPMFNGIEWYIAADYRLFPLWETATGKSANHDDVTAYFINNATLPSQWTNIMPPCDCATFADGSWSIDHDRLYQAKYDMVTSNTSALIESGYFDYKDQAGEVLISVSTDTINQGRFNAKAFMCSLGQLSFPFIIWDGNDDYSFATAEEFMSFCGVYGAYIESIARTGKLLRDTLLTMSDEELIGFYDDRMKAPRQEETPKEVAKPKVKAKVKKNAS